MSPEFNKPKNLGLNGELAYLEVMGVLRKYAAESGGCKAFYSPREWSKRGESYGTNSHLIVVYDGGDLGKFFNMNHEAYSLYEEMQSELRKIGLYFEECTGWYSAIYSIRNQNESS